MPRVTVFNRPNARPDVLVRTLGTESSTQRARERTLVVYAIHWQQVDRCSDGENHDLAKARITSFGWTGCRESVAERRRVWVVVGVLIHPRPLTTRLFSARPNSTLNRSLSPLLYSLPVTVPDAASLNVELGPATYFLSIPAVVTI